ncbi:DegV family protein [uncultured Nocardioides sp.]|uniref:DegV family protein n=1 Tax=uncultured Nocardioides sp. TaxID=198441 RepID=UPI00260038B3|nr:DegV family protein [uncultured Nocardioides sp.]
MGSVAVVTDSTAYLPPGVGARWGVAEVPLHVVLGRRTGIEGVQVSPDEVARALRERRLEVRTSRPTPAEFARVYRATGATDVVSVHLSGALSGTVEAAVLAAREVAPEGIAVRVVDARTIAMGLGFAVLAAAEAAQAGRPPEQVEERARQVARRSRLLFYVDTLEHLRKGGRIGAAAALLGGALSVKPLLRIEDGRVANLERVRTAARALSRLEDLVVGAAGDHQVDVSVAHLAGPDRARHLAARLTERLAEQLGGRDVSCGELGAVLGAHVGPGMVAACVAPRLDVD